MVDANSPLLHGAINVFMSVSEEDCQVLEKVVELRREVRRLEDVANGKV